MRYELADFEWAAIKPRLLPNKPRGIPRVNDRRVLNCIFWVLRSGARWRDLPAAFGPYTTCYNRFVRWRRRVPARWRGRCRGKRRIITSKRGPLLLGAVSHDPPGRRSAGYRGDHQDVPSRHPHREPRALRREAP